MGSLIEDINAGTKKAAFLRKRDGEQSETIQSLHNQIVVLKKKGADFLEVERELRTTAGNLVSKVAKLETRNVELVGQNTLLTKRLRNAVKVQQLKLSNSVTIGDKFFLLVQKLFYIYYNARHTNGGGPDGSRDSAGSSTSSSTS